MKKKPTHITDELKEQSPFLDSFMNSTKGGFSTPDNYFEQLQGKLQERIQAEERTQTAKVISLTENTSKAKARKPSRLKFAAVAASVLMILGVTLWFTNSLQTADAGNSLANLSSEEVLQYLDDNIDEFQFEDLADSGILSSEELNYKSASEITTEEQDVFLSAALEDLYEYN